MYSDPCEDTEQTNKKVYSLVTEDVILKDTELSQGVEKIEKEMGAILSQDFMNLWMMKLLGEWAEKGEFLKHLYTPSM